jgi:hypothetical protein
MDDLFQGRPRCHVGRTDASFGRIDRVIGFDIVAYRLINARGREFMIAGRRDLAIETPGRCKKIAEGETRRGTNFVIFKCSGATELDKLFFGPHCQ